MEQVTLYTKATSLTAEDLQELLDRLASYCHFMILTNEDEKQFLAFDLTLAQELTRWSEGRVFGETTQLQWRKRNGRFAISLLSEIDLKSTADPLLMDMELQTLSCKMTKTRLWGEHHEADFTAEGQPFWLEAQIPQLLMYPYQNTHAETVFPTSLGLRVYQYYKEHHVPAFIRFAGVETVTKKQR